MKLTGKYNSEAALEKGVTKKLKEVGVLGYKFSSPNQRGVPDRLYIARHDNVIFCEFKNPLNKGKLSELQKVVIRDMRENGADVWVVGSIETAEKFMNYVYLVHNNA